MSGFNSLNAIIRKHNIEVRALEQLKVLDWIIFALLIGGIILGYIRGFISQLLSIAGLFIAYVAAYFFYDDLAPWIAKIVPLSSWETYEQYEIIFNSFNLDVFFYNAISFAIIFFGVKIGLTLASYFFNFVAKVPGLNMINKWSGALLGLLEAAVIIVVSIIIMDILPSETMQEIVSDSYIVKWIHEQIPDAAERLHQMWGTE